MNIQAFFSNYPYTVTIGCFSIAFLLYLRFYPKKSVDHRRIDLEAYNIHAFGATLEKLPLWLKKVITYALFPPTLLFNLICYYVCPSGHDWYNRIDESTIVGAMPFYTTVPELYELGVRGVVNTCDEYSGPTKAYEKLGIVQLHLPVIDYTSPTDSQIDRCVEFCLAIRQTGKSIYIHCKAGKGRSVTFAVCVLMKFHKISAQEALRMIIKERCQVSKYVWRRDCVVRFGDRNNLPLREKKELSEIKL